MSNSMANEELKVYFDPPLYQQRRMWILDVLRRENIVDVIDIGCGQGELLAALSQPAPWLRPPPDMDSGSGTEAIPNLHPVTLAGLDLFVSAADLDFTIEGTKPPPMLNLAANQSDGMQRRFTHLPKRWEEMNVKIWKGGLQVLNEEFIGAECIVSTEVIEHLPPSIFDYFAPVLLGVYHPRFLLITTPSYTFNARFTAPDAPKSARKGFPDPTGRTDRIFRHDDHQFEWTVEEFKGWCTKVAEEWGYNVRISDVGRPTEKDPWNRDEALGGASQLAQFLRKDGHETQNFEDRARKLIETLDARNGIEKKAHKLVAQQRHEAHPKAKQPVSLQEIGEQVKVVLERYGDVTQRISELWFDDDIPVLCGGWMELLISAAEEHSDLRLRREDTRFGQEYWIVELIGGIPLDLWPSKADESFDERFLPVEEAYVLDSGNSGLDDTTSADEEADVSWNEDEDVEDQLHAWGEPVRITGTWAWQHEDKPLNFATPLLSSTSSMTGWDGDDSDSDRTS